jgi:hypothetical protein
MKVLLMSSKGAKRCEGIFTEVQIITLVLLTSGISAKHCVDRY